MLRIAMHFCTFCTVMAWMQPGQTNFPDIDVSKIVYKDGMLFVSSKELCQWYVMNYLHKQNHCTCMEDIILLHIIPT